MQKIIGAQEKEFESSLEGYWLGTMHSANLNIERLTDNYKTRFLNRMVPLNPEYLDPESVHFSKIPNDLIVSLKRDGVFNTLYYDNKTQPESVFCSSPGGRIIHSSPVNYEINDRIAEINEFSINDLKDMLQRFNKEKVFKKINNIEKIVLGGELFANIDRPNDRPRVFDYIKLSRNPESKDDLDNLYYDIFDVISINDVELLDLSYEYRIELIDFLFPRTAEAKVKVVEYKIDVKAEDLIKIYDKWVVKEHHEGFIVRTKYNMSYKVKPRFDIDAVIIGFVEMLEEKKVAGEDSVSSTLVAVMRDDGTYQELAHVGGGFTFEQRADLFNLLKEDIVKSNYRATKRDGRAFHLVEPKHVIQLNYTDIITETTSGEIVKRMALKFENGMWTPIKNTKFVSIIHPRFELFRSEVDNELFPSLEYANIKNPTPEDVNISQVSSIVPVESPEALEPPKELPKITMIARIVFKGYWATNKHEIDPLYPKYVVYFVDYNYTRRTPLEQNIYPFNSLEKTIKHVNWLIKRPDDKNKSFLDPKGNLKRSIKSPPYSVEFNKDFKGNFDKILEENIKTILNK